MSATAFYDTRAWRRKRREVLRGCNNECQLCRERPGHPHVPAVVVHHVYHLEEYPQWGLMEFVRDPLTGERKRNLLPVCRECHETVCHPERMRALPECKPLVTPERW